MYGSLLLSTDETSTVDVGIITTYIAYHNMVVLVCFDLFMCVCVHFFVDH